MNDVIRKERRFKKFLFNICFEVRWLIKVLQELPKDSYVVAVDYDINLGCSVLLISSPMFSKVADAAEPPSIKVEIDTIKETVELFEYGGHDTGWKDRPLRFGNGEQILKPTRKIFKEVIDGE